MNVTNDHNICKQQVTLNKSVHIYNITLKCLVSWNFSNIFPRKYQVCPGLPSFCSFSWASQVSRLFWLFGHFRLFRPHEMLIVLYVSILLNTSIIMTLFEVPYKFPKFPSSEFSLVRFRSFRFPTPALFISYFHFPNPTLLISFSTFQLQLCSSVFPL